MIAPLPATIVQEIERDLVKATLSAREWLRADDEIVLTLEDRLEKLAKVNAADASVLRGSLAHLQGDVEQMEHWFRNAERNHAMQSDVDSSRFHALANLGYFSEAAAVLNATAAMGHGRLQRLLLGALITACFERLIELAPRARAAGLEINEEDAAIAQRAVATLRSLGLHEADVLALIDRLGRVQRSHRLFWAGRAPEVSVSSEDDEPGLLFQFHVKGAADDVLAWNDEALDLCIDANVVKPGLAAVFVPEGASCP